MVQVNLEYLKKNPGKAARNGVRYIPEASLANSWTKALTATASEVGVLAATVNGVAASNTGIAGLGSISATPTLPYNYKLAAVGSDENGDFLVVGWDNDGNPMSESVNADSATATAFSKNFVFFPTRGFAHLIENDATYALDSGDDFQIVDSTGTALIMGNVDIADTNLATPLPAIVVPPQGYAVVNYLAVTAADLTNSATVKCKVYDCGTGETSIIKSTASADNNTTTWFDYATAPYATHTIEGGKSGKVLYFTHTPGGTSDNTLELTYKMDYDLYGKWFEGGVQGLIDNALRASSVDQTS